MGWLSSTVAVTVTFSMKRDSTSKWISFIKTIGAIAIAAAMLYGGNSVYQSNVSTQQKLIDSIETRRLMQYDKMQAIS